MSVIFDTRNGWLIDHRKSPDLQYHFKVKEVATMLPDYNRNLDVVCCESRPISFRLSERFFLINAKFLMDSQFAKECRSSESKESGVSNDTFKKCRRKRKLPVVSERPLEVYHDEIKEFLQNTIGELVQMDGQLGLKFLAKDPPLDNNVEARTVATSLFEHSRRLSRLTESLSTALNNDDGSDRSRLQCFSLRGSEVVAFSSIFNTFVVHDGDRPCVMQLEDEKYPRYFIPPKCSFLMSDVRLLNRLADTGKQFDFIVIDPPWCNKSVKRKKGYWMLKREDISAMPIGRFARNGTLVAVWTTNSSSWMKFVHDDLFPSWGIAFVADWHWLKITTRGEPVCDINSSHKKPYEHLIIGQRCEGDAPGAALKLQNHRVFCSVPSSLHSHKPPLTELFKPYLPKDCRCLDLFARYLLPGWTSCGNEVLLFQHSDFYDVCSEEQT